MYNLTEPNSTFVAIAILAGAALLHASFQLSVSMMTLLSGHAIGNQRSHGRLMHLCSSYTAGNITIALLLILSLTYVVSSVAIEQAILWKVTSFIGFIVGIVTLLFYYRNAKLWLPASAAEYLYDRSKRTKRGIEAYSLGLTTGAVELPFILAPLFIAGMILRGQPDISHLAWALAYVLIACLPLFVILILIGGGTKISHIQRWRDQNRQFIHLASGLGLMILSVYIYTVFGISEKGQSI